ncbi:MAG: tRNA (adenosine(37)-N6)-dimethylallyltransferase MiaA [Bacilli bacterium]
MNKIIVITGPTAVGKTKLSIEIAKQLNGEIINADSTQIFKNMDIATAKIKPEEKENIKHHLIDIKDYSQDYNVYDYQIDCRNIIDKLFNKSKTPIIVGGTGLYIKAALYDYKFTEYNSNLNLEQYTNEELNNEILKHNITSEVHINNRKRLINALKNSYTNNDDYKGKDKLLYDVVFICLTTNRETLYERINKRVDVMFEAGLIEEAKTIYKTNIRTKAVMTPIGYKELFEYFENNISLEDVKELIKKRSRNYAKRQYTWFRNQMNLKFIEVNFDNFNNTIAETMNYIQNS